MTEKISSLFDNELSEAERDRELSKLRPGTPEFEAWERYARIRAELRGEMPAGDGFASGDLADRISAVLREEPTQFAPGGARERDDHPAIAESTTTSTESESAQAGSGATVSELRRRRLPWVAGLAVAASVAAVSLIGPGKVVNETPAPEPLIAETTAQPSPAATVASTGSTQTVTGLAPVVWKESGTGWQKRDTRHAEGHARRLNAMLVAHAEYSPAASMNGMAAYARFVSYDPSRDDG